MNVLPHVFTTFNSLVEDKWYMRALLAAQKQVRTPNGWAAAMPEDRVEGWHPSPDTDPRAPLAFKDGRSRPDFDY